MKVPDNKIKCLDFSKHGEDRKLENNNSHGSQITIIQNDTTHRNAPNRPRHLNGVQHPIRKSNYIVDDLIW